MMKPSKNEPVRKSATSVLPLLLDDVRLPSIVMQITRGSLEPATKKNKTHKRGINQSDRERYQTERETKRYTPVS